MSVDLFNNLFAVYSSKQISSATTLLRDLWWDVCNIKTDAYFVSLDSRKPLIQ